MPDKRIEDFATLAETKSDDLLLVSSENETYNVKFETLKSAVRGDPELLGIRSGYNGKVYPTAGEAVREQCKELNLNITKINSTEPISPLEATTGKFIDSSGQMASAGEYVTLKFISKHYDKFIISGFLVGASAHLISTFNRKMELVKQYETGPYYNAGPKEYVDYVFTPSADEFYTYITFTKGSGDTVYDYSVKSNRVNKEYLKYAGKSVICFGDSTTYGDNGIDGGGHSISWVSYLQELCGFSSVGNMGVCGSTIADRADEYVESFVKRLKNLKSADVFIIMGGVNDKVYSVPLGFVTSGEKDTASFLGALQTIVETIVTNYPNAKIIFQTPLKYNKTYAPNAVNLKQDDYVNAIKSLCGRFSIPVNDLYNNCGITPLIPAQNEMFFGDGLHPNALGYERLARECIAPFLNNLV